MKTPAILIVLAASICGTQQKATLNIREPLSLTISPKVWNLLETKAKLINDLVKSIKIPEKEEKIKMFLKYKVWDGHIEHLSIPKTGVTLENMNNGIHLRLKDVQFSGSIQARLYVGGWLSRIGLDVILKWNDFTFTPIITMNSDLHIDFTSRFRKFNAFRRYFQKLATQAVNKKVPEKLVELIKEKLNPKLQKLKRKLMARGLTDYDIEWTVQNQILRVALKPKSSTVTISLIKPINEMVCIEVNLAQSAPRGKRSLSLSSIDVTCVNTVLKCEGSACSQCTDIDINPLPLNANGHKFPNCIPEFLDGLGFNVDL
uniref:BPI1 domain-containing protein n=1 Tax=Haemonchus contortus TaxID=6289 RepID=A0A7I4YSU1_HAECO